MQAGPLPGRGLLEGQFSPRPLVRAILFDKETTLFGRELVRVRTAVGPSHLYRQRQIRLFFTIIGLERKGAHTG